MREVLKNDLLLLLNEYVDSDVLRNIDQKIELLLSNYEVESRKTEIINYEYTLPETIQIYIVSKKISGLSDKSLYLYNIVLSDFFYTVQRLF